MPIQRVACTMEPARRSLECALPSTLQPNVRLSRASDDLSEQYHVELGINAWGPGTGPMAESRRVLMAASAYLGVQHGADGRTKSYVPGGSGPLLRTVPPVIPVPAWPLKPWFWPRLCNCHS